MMQKLKELYLAEMFKPSALGILTNPFWLARRGLYRGIAANAGYIRGKVLDFGCGRKPYQELFDFEEYVGLDVEESGHRHQAGSVDVFYDGETIPFADGYFDSALASQVFEHLFNLGEVLAEIHRVLRPGGHLLATVPFVWDEHEKPYDFARYTSFGIEHLLAQGGFEVVVMEKTGNAVETVFQLWNAYVGQRVLPSNPYLNLLLTPLLVAPATIAGAVLSKILPASQDLYLDNVVVARKRR
jgi:SAM-dependent methyltransferase